MPTKGGINLAFVSVPKDLTKVKNKVVLNLTKRQIICLAIAAAIGLPFLYWDEQRGDGHGGPYAPRFFICHV